MVDKREKPGKPKARKPKSSKTDVQPNIEKSGVTDVTDVTGVTSAAGAASSGNVGISGDVTGVTKPIGSASSVPLDIKTVVDHADTPDKWKAEGAKAPGRRSTGQTKGSKPANLTAKDGAPSGSLENPPDGAASTDTKPGDLVPVVSTGGKRRRVNGVVVSEADPDEPARPSYVVREDWSRFGPAGVWFHGHKSDGKDKGPDELNLWLCSPLHVEAVTCGENDYGFGRLLSFRDTFGHWHRWAMPMELLRGSCEEIRGELLAAGVHIDYRDRGRLADYLLSSTPERRVLAAIRTGWTRDGTVFVLPERVIPETAEVHYQAETLRQEGEAEKGGDFETWKTDIAALCVGNPILALSLCVALAGPLLAKVCRDTGGIHWVGDSTTGKTTALHMAGSVWGGEAYRRTWKGTANGFEGVAAARNDTFLPLDEINQADPKEVGSIVYMLGNETGKQRAHLDGMFDALHGFPDGRALADYLKTHCGRHYGHAGPAFIEALLKDGRDFGRALAEVEALSQFDADNGQEGRGAARFALYGMAGELATEWGILPWPEGEAIRAAAEGYRLWREGRGGGATEDRQILQAVADFISRHGDSRFSHKAGDEEVQREAVVIQRAGWWVDLDDVGRVYLFAADGLREATRGHDFTRVLNALDSAGWIQDRGGKGERAKLTVIGKRRIKLYWILPGDLDE